MGIYSNEVCERILSELREQHMTRKQLSKALGITYNQMCNLLNNRCSLTIDRLYDISKILDKSVAEFL